MSEQRRLDEELLRFAGELAAELDRGDEGRLDGFAERCDELLEMIQRVRAVLDASGAVERTPAGAEPEARD